MAAVRLTIEQASKQGLLFCKKEAKNFCLLPLVELTRFCMEAPRCCRCGVVKVFWSFFPKKDCLLSVCHIPCELVLYQPSERVTHRKQAVLLEKRKKTVPYPHLQQRGAFMRNEASQPEAGDKSFLLLFFKKEGLACLLKCQSQRGLVLRVSGCLSTDTEGFRSAGGRSCPEAGGVTQGARRPSRPARYGTAGRTGPGGRSPGCSARRCPADFRA